MKTSFVFATATALLAQRTLALEKCNYSVVAPQLHSLGPEITACHAATGYYLAPPPAPPTAEQQQGICTKCTAFITKVTPMVWPECTLNLAGTDQTLTVFFNSVTAPCAVTQAPPTSAPTSAPTTAPGPTTEPVVKPTDAPTTTPTTPAPTDGTKPTPTTTEPTSC